VCASLPAATAGSAESRHLIVDFIAHTIGSPPQPPARVHLYTVNGGGQSVVGLERPDQADEPG
jgi:hypothetical protein